MARSPLSVNVTAFRQALPRYLTLARRGTRVRLTSRGVAVAELGPAPAAAGDVSRARRLLRGSVVAWRGALDPTFAPGEWDAER